jgi:hypothetical protein
MTITTSKSVPAEPIETMDVVEMKPLAGETAEETELATLNQTLPAVP